MSLQGTENADITAVSRKIAEELRFKNIEPYEIQRTTDQQGNPQAIKKPTMQAFEAICYDLMTHRAEVNDLKWKLHSQRLISIVLLFLCLCICIAIGLYWRNLRMEYIDEGFHISDVVLIFVGIVIGTFAARKGFRDWYNELNTKDEKLVSEVLEMENELHGAKERLKAEAEILKAKAVRVRWECEQNERRRIRRADMMAQYDGKPVRFLFPVPPNMFVADGGFPAVKGWKREDYWVYITLEGKCYHRKGCGSVYYGAESVRVWDIPRKYLPCLKCQPKRDNFTWYNQMRDLEKELRRFGFRMEIRNETMYLVDLEAQSQSSETL